MPSTNRTTSRTEGATTAAPPGRWVHVPALDGIRGLAVLGVVAHHLEHLPGGYLGVDAFFVLSGFLITSILLDEAADGGGVDLTRFWVRRAKRLLPALLVVLATVLAVERLLADGSSGSAVRNEALAALGYVYNWYAIAGDVDYWSSFAAPSPLRHMWSLAIEEQFYVLWPLVVAAIFGAARAGRRHHQRMIGAVAGLGAVASIVVAQSIWSPADVLRVYYGTDTRIAAILLGAVAAVLVRELGVDRSTLPLRPWASAAGLVLVVGIGWAWATLEGTDRLLYRGGFVGVGLATTAVIVLTHLSPGTMLDRSLSFAPLRWVGRVSYGLYLWHWPVIVWVTTDRTGLDGIALLTVRLVLSFGLTVLSYRLIELPSRRVPWGGRRTAGVAVPAVAAVVVMALVSSPGSAVDLQRTRPGAGTRSTLPIPPLPIPPLPIPNPSIPTPSTSMTDPAGPVTTDVADHVRLMVVGDSGAYFVGELLLALADGESTVVLPRGEIGCGIVNLGGGAVADQGFLPDPPDCDRWPERWAADAAAFRPTDVLVVLSWPGIGDRELDGVLRHPCDPVFDAHHRERFRLAIDVAGSSGATVWLADSPDLAGSTPGDLSTERIACVNDSIRSTLSAYGTGPDGDAAARLLELRSWVCPAGRCLTEIDGEVLRPDGLHFDGPGGRRAAEWILERVVGGRA